MFLEGLEKYQRQWKLIAQSIKTRTVVQVRTHAQKFYQKIARAKAKALREAAKKEQAEVIDK